MAKVQVNSIAGTPDDPTAGFEVFDLEDLKPSDRQDGKWYLRWNFGAIAKAEKITGMNLLTATGGFLVDTATVTEYIGLLYACLLRAHPEVTFDYVAENMVRLDQIQHIRLALIKAVNRTLPEKKKIPYNFVVDEE